MSPGAFRANAPAMDVEAMERDLGRIPAVTLARVVVEADELKEVHIVCGVGRSPKLVGRDVQSLLAARWGVDVDHRKVSVVQLEGGDEEEAEAIAADAEAEAAAAPAPRSRASRATPAAPVAPPVEAASSDERAGIASLSLSLTGTSAQASVTVAIGEREATGTAHGMPSWAGQRRLAALATLDALASLVPGMDGFAVGDITTVRMGAEDVVVTTLSGWRDGAETNLAGAAPIGAAGELRAAAESVLQAAPTAS